MNIWILIAAGFALLALAMLVLARISIAGSARAHRRIAELEREIEQDAARIEELGAVLHADANEFQAKLLRTEHSYSAQLKERDEEITRLKQQLADVVYEVKQNIVVDVAQETPKEVVYEVKTPRSRKKQVATE